MEKDGTPFVWLSMENIADEDIKKHFPHIYERCLEEGYDATKECIPVVPSQHYFMGGVDVDSNSMTSMDHLYAAGETSCNGVHGRNRLASNSLLESIVFAKRAALHIIEDNKESIPVEVPENWEEEYKIDLNLYKDEEKYAEDCRQAIMEEIKREELEEA